MPQTYPNDADGDALRRVASDNDLSRPMTVDFHIAAPDQATAERIASATYALGYRCAVYDSAENATELEDASGWTCQCSTRMLLTYSAVIAIQAELHLVADPLGGFVDGWGTFGNNETSP